MEYDELPASTTWTSPRAPEIVVHTLARTPDQEADYLMGASSALGWLVPVGRPAPP